MPQPRLLMASGHAVAKFGNLPLPKGQGTLANINLSDGVNTSLVAFKTDETNRQISLAQLLYRARGTYLSDDFGPRLISLPMNYYEDATHFVGAFLAALSQAGEQQLTFDNATYIPCKYQSAGSRQEVWPYIPRIESFTLELIAPDPWFRDNAPTTMAPLTLTADTGQTFNITYAGSVWAEPVWTLVVPVGNTVPINFMQLQNPMSGEYLTVNFQSVAALAAGVARTITIDCAAETVTDDLGNFYDHFGSFPKLYSPPGQVNPFNVVIVPASGSSSGLTLACSHTPRWQI